MTAAQMETQESDPTDLANNQIYQKYFIEEHLHYLPANVYDTPYGRLIKTQLSLNEILATRMVASRPFFECFTGGQRMYYMQWDGDSVVNRDSRLSYIRKDHWEQTRKANEIVGARLSAIYKTLAVFRSKIKK